MLQAALCLIALAAPAALSAQAIAPPRPGLLYYGEGVVILNGERKPSGKVGMMYWEPGKPVLSKYSIGS